MENSELQFEFHDTDKRIEELAKIKKFYIPMFSGRPKRDTQISHDDVINLKIDLGLSKDVNDVYSETKVPYNPFWRESIYA
jgi:hypothetical protein